MLENEAGIAPETEAPAVAAATEAPTETAAPDDDALGAIYDRLMSNNGADRGEDGKFVSPNGTEQAKEAPHQTIEGGDEETPAEAEAPVSEATVNAPAHLPQSIKGQWEKMPVEARDAIAQWTAEQDRKFGEQGRALAQYKPLQDAVSEYKEYFDGTKGRYQPAEAVRYLFNLQRQMDAKPLDTLLEIADTYGLRQHLTQPTDSVREISALRQTISELRTELARNATPERIEDTVSSVLEKRQVSEAIERFAKEQLFYADVEKDLPDFISIARSKMPDASPLSVLERAYHMAVNANDDVRAKKEAAEAKAKAAKSADPKRTEAAKRAASINVTSAGTGKQTFKSEEEAMAAAYDRLMATP
jgi:hypothetical protein